MTVVVVVVHCAPHALGHWKSTVTVGVVEHHGFEVGLVTVTVASWQMGRMGQLSVVGTAGHGTGMVVVAVKQLVGEGPTHLSVTMDVITCRSGSVKKQ